MIKLIVEIKEKTFSYDYEIGECKEHGEHPLSPESFCAFVNMLRYAQNAYVNQHEAWIEEIKAKAYLEKHPELLVKKEKE